MKKLKNNEFGFSAIENLLIVVTMAVVVGVGWYVWNNKNLSHKSTKNVLIKASINKDSSNTLKIPELSIEIINVPTSLHDLTYEKYYSDSSGVDIDLTTKTLESQDPSCGLGQGSEVAFLNKSYGTFDDPKIGPLIKQFNGFFITYSKPTHPCSSNPKIEALHALQVTDFYNLITNQANILLLN